MMLITIIILFIVLIIAITTEQKSRINKLRKWNREHYGKKPAKVNCDWEKIGYYWSEYAESISNDEKLDDVTWNDLEMDHIFNRINTCLSFAGEQILYYTLHCLKKKDSYSGDRLESKINFFKNNDREREEIQLVLSKLSKVDGYYLLPMFVNKLEAFRIPGIRGYRFMQIILLTSIFPAIILLNPVYLTITLGIFIINMLIYAINKSKYEVVLDTLNAVIGVVKAGGQIADTKKFSYEDKFHDLKEKVSLFKELTHMIGSLKRSKEISLSGSLEAIMYDYLVGATLWDFVKFERIIHILQGKQNEFIDLYKKIGEIDMAIAVASFRTSLTLYCTPTFSEEPVLQMEDLYHPLIEAPVYNTVTLDKSCIITGSNASGKSTFIKAVAINVILAQSIHTCMAKKMILPYAYIITSMAVRDNLMSGESYYIKEIKYLNRIIQSLHEERFVICAIDEILRGTNTEERITASTAILKYLSKKNCIAIVASHDFELTVRLNKLYDNFHFSEIIEDNDIVFEYKIYEGATASKNAIKLLELMKFPREIIDEARNPL